MVASARHELKLQRRYFMRRTLILSFAAVVAFGGLLLTTVTAQQKGSDKAKHDEQQVADRPHCIVMDDDPIDFRVSVMTDDGPVYFCCKHCIKKYKADTAKYADHVKTQREALAKMPHVQVTCPLSGEPVKSSVFVEEKG